MFSITFFSNNTEFDSCSILTVFCFFLKIDFSGDADRAQDQDGQVEFQLRAELQQKQEQLKCAHDNKQEAKSRIESLRYSHISSNSKNIVSIVYITTIKSIGHIVKILIL